ncbi:MAG: trypsin-like peptidase domain-containing protein [Bacteroidales bacterium]|nr:trypsin-like peptidase domain-containing protein [Bacteroidales bacterium]
MEYVDELRALTVRVENGSGVLVRPLSEEYDYVLTAYHVIKHFDGKDAKEITIDHLSGDIRVEAVDVVKNIDSDAAVILVKKVACNLRFAYPKTTLPNEEKRWHMGYPNNQNGKGEAKKCVEHEIRNWLGSYEEKYVKYQCQQTIEKCEIEGMSGGGVFDSHFHLLGVHRGFTADLAVEQLGKFVMIPWECFEEIISYNKLPEVLPFDLSSLKTFKEQIFCFGDNLGARMKLKQLMAQLAILKASMEDWSPKTCYEAFQQYRQARQYVKSAELEENDWVLFGEFLVAMKILLKEKGISNCDDIFPHFQYVQSERDFDIFEVDDHLDPDVLGKVKDDDVVFVIGGISGKGYKQDVRSGGVIRINDSREPGGMFDIARMGKDVFGAFTFVNGNLFKEAMQENTDEIQDAQDCIEFYQELLSKKIWSKKKDTERKA